MTQTENQVLVLAILFFIMVAVFVKKELKNKL